MTKTTEWRPVPDGSPAPWLGSNLQVFGDELITQDGSHIIEHDLRDQLRLCQQVEVDTPSAPDEVPVALDFPDGLRPCPFCGGEAKLLKEVRTHYVVCKHCGAGTHGAVDSDIAREQWNKRTTPSATPGAAQQPAPQWAYSGPATIDVYGGGLLKMRLDGPEFPQGAPQSGVHDITLTLKQPRTA